MVVMIIYIPHILIKKVLLTVLKPLIKRDIHVEYIDDNSQDHKSNESIINKPK